jgi:hypothetical protein
VVVPPSPVTDYFNGFELSGSTYSGGPTVVADHSGALVTSQADVLPIEGMRLSGSTWLPTTSLGAQIHPSTPLRTRKGTVSVYSEDFKGPLIEPARTNLLTDSEQINLWTASRATVSPDAVTVHSGAVAMDLLLETVDSATHRAYKAINSKASGAVLSVSVHCKKYNRKYCAFRYGENAELDFVTVVFNFDTQEALLLYGGAMPQDGVVSVKALADGVYRVTLTNTSYNTTGGTVYLMGANDAGSVAHGGDVLKGSYFYGVQVEVGAFPTSYIPTAATTVTRPAANLTRPTAGTALAALNNWGIRLRFRPTAAGQTAVLWGSYTDANNATRVDLAASTLTYTKRLSGSDHVAQIALTHAAATLYDVIIYQHSVSGMGIAFRSWNGSAWSAWSAWATLTDANGIANAAIASTYQLGASNNASHVSANMPFCHVFTLKAALAAQTEIADLLSKGRI